jgi:hypothetical protein
MSTHRTDNSSDPTTAPKKKGLFGNFLSLLMGGEEEAPEEAKATEEVPEFLVRPGARPLYKRRPRSSQRPVVNADGKARGQRTLDEQRRQNQFAQLVLVDRRRKVQEQTHNHSTPVVEKHQTKKQILAMQALPTGMELELHRELRGCIASQGDFHLLHTSHDEGGEGDGEVRCCTVALRLTHCCAATLCNSSHLSPPL